MSKLRLRETEFGQSKVTQTTNKNSRIWTETVQFQWLCSYPLYYPASPRSSLYILILKETVPCCTPFIWYSLLTPTWETIDQVFLLWQVFHYFTVPTDRVYRLPVLGLIAISMHWLLCFKTISYNCLLLKLQVVSFQSRFKCCSSLHGSWHRRCTIIICWIEFKD